MAPEGDEVTDPFDVSARGFLARSSMTGAPRIRVQWMPAASQSKRFRTQREKIRTTAAPGLVDIPGMAPGTGGEDGPSEGRNASCSPSTQGPALPPHVPVRAARAASCRHGIATADEARPLLRKGGGGRDMRRPLSFTRQILSRRTTLVGSHRTAAGGVARAGGANGDLGAVRCSHGAEWQATLYSSVGRSWRCTHGGLRWWIFPTRKSAEWKPRGGLRRPSRARAG